MIKNIRRWYKKWIIFLTTHQVQILQNIQDNNLQREWGQCRMFSMQMWVKNYSVAEPVDPKLFCGTGAINSYFSSGYTAPATRLPSRNYLLSKFTKLFTKMLSVWRMPGIGIKTNFYRNWEIFWWIDNITLFVQLLCFWINFFHFVSKNIGLEPELEPK